MALAGERVAQLTIDPEVVADRDLAIWLERSEALAYGKQAYEAAAELPGNPARAVAAIDFGFFNRMIGLGIERAATEDDVEAVSRFFIDLGARSPSSTSRPPPTRVRSPHGWGYGAIDPAPGG
jgi:hypothetical protein